MYPTRRVSVTFSIEDGEGSKIKQISSGSPHRVAERVAKAARKEEAATIKTSSGDQIYRAREARVGSIEDVERWALHQQDANAGVRCAGCEEEIGFGEGCSSPYGSMHKGCASENEKRQPAMW